MDIKTHQLLQLNLSLSCQCSWHCRAGTTALAAQALAWPLLFFVPVFSMHAQCSVDTCAQRAALSKQAVHRRRNQSGWSGHGRTVLSRSWDIITCSAFVWSWIAVVKFGRYIPKCTYIRLTFGMTKLPGLRIPVWSWSAMRAPPRC